MCGIAVGKQVCSLYVFGNTLLSLDFKVFWFLFQEALLFYNIRASHRYVAFLDGVSSFLEGHVVCVDAEGASIPVSWYVAKKLSFSGFYSAKSWVHSIVVLLLISQEMATSAMLYTLKKYSTQSCLRELGNCTDQLCGGQTLQLFGKVYIFGFRVGIFK